MTVETLPLAAVLFERGEPVDAVLAAAVVRLRADGLTVAGAVQEEIADGPDCCGPTVLRSLTDGSARVISQDLGRLASGCRLDPAALADAAAALAAVVDDAPDLLVLNRFGKAEAEGGGLRAVIERAMEHGLPVVVAVRTDHAAAWDAFHGGLAAALPADAGAIAAWVRGRRAPAHAA